jgi:hypothetical protein
MGSEDRLRVYWEADCSEAERERDCITFDRVGRVGERRNFQISDAKMNLLSRIGLVGMTESRRPSSHPAAGNEQTTGDVCQDITSTERQAVQIEYKFNPKWSVSGTRDQTAGLAWMEGTGRIFDGAGRCEGMAR